MAFDFVNTVTPASAPTLSSPADVSTSSTSGAGSVTTDTGSGTLYYVLSSSATAPSAAQIKAGNDHTGSAAVASGSQAVSATGNQTTPTITGLAPSTTYYLHFVQNAAGGDSNVASGDGFATPASGSASVTIAVSGQASRIAPAGIELEATNLSGFDVSEPTGGAIYDATYAGVTFVWTLRGSPLSAYPRIPATNAALNNPNLAYGKKAGFRLPAGTYDIDLWCIDATGNTATDTVQITVAAPSFASADTIAFALDGNFTGAPSATTQVSTIAALNSAISGRTNPTRVSFKPGETIPEALMWIDAANIQYVDTWTPGSIVTWLCKYPSSGIAAGTQNSYGVQFAFSDNNPQSQFTMRDIRMEGDWDALSETGHAGGGNFTFSRCQNPIDVMVHDCEFSGFGYVSFDLPEGSGAGSSMFFTDCKIENWQGFGIASFPQSDGNARYYMMGNDVAQDPAVLCGGPEDISNDHGCLRMANAELIYARCNNWRSFAGWSGNPPPANANCRLHSSTEADSYTVWDANVMEGGYIQVKIDGQNTGQPELAGNHLIERNVMIGNARTFAFFSAHFGGTTFRNNLCYMPDVPIFDGFIYEFRNIDPEAPAAGNDVPFQVYNNSYISRETAGNRPLVINHPDSVVPSAPDSWWSQLDDVNNLFYNPGSTGEGPVDFSTVLAGVVPITASVRFNYQAYSGTFSSLANGASVVLPYSSFDRSTGFTHPILNTGSTASTDQAYWQAAEAAGDDRHFMKCNLGIIYAHLGHFAVAYEAGGIRITNTSGSTLDGGYLLRLDRKSHLDTDLPPATAYASPTSIPTCAPQSGAKQVSGSPRAYDSLNQPGVARSGTIYAGALQP